MDRILDEVLAELAKRYPAGTDNQVMTDVLIQVNTDSGQITVYDDDDNEIYSAVVQEWINDDASDNSSIASTIRDYLTSHKERVESLSLLKPYSFLLIDEDKETISELYLVDDQLIVLDSQSLMQGLDQDLDNFFDQLMKE